ncbi:MAG: DUF5946 family protein [Gemmatimonadaceae bacterium]
MTRANAAQHSRDSEQEAYDELSAYTLMRGDATFIHQHVVDAFAVQYSDEQTKSIKLTFGLVGLYLKIEKQFSGRQVQLAHMQMARKKHVWPAFEIPADRGSMRPSDVIAAPPGQERDKAIDSWCASVWAPWQSNRPTIASLLEQHEIGHPG